ncbi:MAG TPA: XTP/dITP diphosphatase [Candidatus Thermoplasmatota archaeon]|nr:XTP/dITP diphosphatase [Candidatus Thermoplasmatota archaeon]
MKKLYFITSNQGKVKEAIEKLRPLGYSVIQKDLGYPEVQADSLEEVALQGIAHIQAKYHQAFMLEDAGLFIDTLQGFPGVYSKYVFFTIGLPGILRLLENKKNRNAVFRSVYVYSEPGKTPVIVVGECSGMISAVPRGEHGFGYDPLFVPQGSEKTFGEMTIEEKNRFSHRSKALEKLVTELKNSR